MSGGSRLNRKSLKKGDYEKTYEVLWFSQFQGMGSSVTGPMLQIKTFGALVP